MSSVWLCVCPFLLYGNCLHAVNCWGLGSWSLCAVSPTRPVPPLSGFSHFSSEGMCPLVALLLHHRRGCWDAVLGISSAVVSMTTWHPSSSPAHLLGLLFMALECFPPFLAHQDTVPQSFTYLATLPLSPLVPFS